MLRRLARHPLFWSPVAAMAIQLALATAVAAASGGADFPFRRS